MSATRGQELLSGGNSGKAMYIVLAIIAFGVLIAVHEFGHFAAARACGVRVIEFSLGMGPALLKKQGKETLYSLRALPIGGYCAMEGDDDDSDSPRSFAVQPVWKRAVILSAGAAMNFVVGFLLAALVMSQSEGYSAPRIEAFMDGCPYEGENMLMAGDTFYKIDGSRIYFFADISESLAGSGSEYHDIVVVRNGHKVKLENFRMALVEYPTEDGGTELKYGIYGTFEPKSIGSCLKYSWYCSLSFVRLVWRSLEYLVTGAVSVKEVSGPVAIVGLVNDIATEEAARTSVKEALLDVAYLFALIAVNLAVMNLLPLPALDGGRVASIIVVWVIETVSRRRLNPKYEGYVHSVALILLMGLMVLVMVNDIVKLIANR